MVAVLLLGAQALAGPPAAIPDPDPAHARALRSFEGFAASWMRKMRKGAAITRRKPARNDPGARRTYVDYDGSFRVELRPTGRPRAPFVGILRYAEIEYACADHTNDHCTAASRQGVTEIFRFEDGHWVY